MQKQNTLVWFYLCNLFLPLVLGFIIYLGFRPDTYVSSYFCIITGWTPVLWYSDSSVFQWVFVFLRNYSCDILWAYSLPIALWIFHNHTYSSLFLIGIESIAFEILIEFLQYKTIISGTFDLWDIILEGTGSIAAILMVLFRFRKFVISNL